MFKNREVKESNSTKGQFITFGIQKLKITGIKSQKSTKPEARRFYKFEVETLEKEGFKGFEDAKGKIGTVSFLNNKLEASWFNPELDTEYDKPLKEEFLNFIVLLADKAGVREELNKFPDDISWDDMLEKFIGIMENKYILVLIAANEYEKGKFNKSFGLGISGKNEEGYSTFSALVKHANFIKDFSDTTKVKISKTGIITQVEGVNVVGNTKGEKKVIIFDMIYHYKKFEESDIEESDIKSSELPEMDNITIPEIETTDGLPF